MSDFGEICPLFNTGVYKELYLGELTGTIYDSATFNFMSSAGDPATAPSSFRFGRTIVVTEVYAKRKTISDNLTHTICLFVGRRTGSGTATQSIFGTLCISMSVTAFPKIINAWQAVGVTSFTLNTADVLDISMTLPDLQNIELIVQYREK